MDNPAGRLEGEGHGRPESQINDLLRKLSICPAVRGSDDGFLQRHQQLVVKIKKHFWRLGMNTLATVKGG